jgi:hypothetical protein
MSVAMLYMQFEVSFRQTGQQCLDHNKGEPCSHYSFSSSFLTPHSSSRDSTYNHFHKRAHRTIHRSPAFIELTFPEATNFIQSSQVHPVVCRSPNNNVSS